jgi:hypothetical protein
MTNIEIGIIILIALNIVMSIYYNALLKRLNDIEAFLGGVVNFISDNEE